MTSKPSHHRVGSSWPQNNIIHNYREIVAPPISLQQTESEKKTMHTGVIDNRQVQKYGRVKILWSDHNPPLLNQDTVEKNYTINPCNYFFQVQKPFLFSPPKNAYHS